MTLPLFRWGQANVGLGIPVGREWEKGKMMFCFGFGSAFRVQSPYPCRERLIRRKSCWLMSQPLVPSLPVALSNASCALQSSLVPVKLSARYTLAILSNTYFKFKLAAFSTVFS